MDPTMIAGGIFGAVALMVLVGWSVVNDLANRDNSRIRRRVDDELRNQQREQIRQSRLFKDLSGLRLDPSSGVFDTNELAQALAEPPPQPGLARLTPWLETAGVTVTPDVFVWGTVGLAVFLGVAGWLASGIAVAVCGLLVGLFAPYAVVNYRIGARREKFLKQLPDAFDLMGRVLKAGQSVPQAFQAVADAFDAPLATEFSWCQEQQNLGMMPEATYQDLARRVDLLEVRIFVMAMLIQRQAGGNLSETLERLAGLVRERLKLRNHIRTLTAEGRMQAMVLVAMPPVMFVVMMILNREYASLLLKQPTLIAVTAGAMAAGLIWIRNIVNQEP